MPPRKPRPLSVKDELRYQAWAHQNGVTDDQRAYWRSLDSQRIPQDILPTFRPRNRAGEVARSLAFQHPTLAGVLSGTGNVAKGIARFIPDALRGLTSYTPEELRDPEVRQHIIDNNWGDPDVMLHEALKARGRGEPVGSAEYAAALLKGTALMGYNLQRAVQGGEALYERDENGRFKVSSTDVSPRERSQAVTEMLANAGLLVTGVQDKALPISRLPLSAAGRAAAALRDAVGPTAILPQDWAAGARTPGPGPRTPVGNLNLEAPTFMREKFTAQQSPIDNLNLNRPTFQRRAALSDIRRDFNRMIGGDQPLPRVKSVDEPVASRMAKTYEDLQNSPNDPQVREAYDAFNRETQAQADALHRAGYTWEFVDEDPYPPTKGGSKAMLRDLRERHHIKVYKTTGEQSHPLMTNEQNNLFRAVHEIMGHGIDNVPFSAVGEENAFRSHAQAYSPLARRVMATETRGQNSWFNYGPHRGTPAPARPFSPQKAALWPTEMLGDYPDFPKADAPVWNRSPALQQAMDRGMITSDRMVPSVKGTDGEYYTGINHEDASSFAAERFRERIPAAERDYSKPVVVRGSEGFRLNNGEYVSRERAAQVARGQGLVPNLAKEWTSLHSSDINNPGNFAGEYPVPKDLIDAAAGRIAPSPGAAANAATQPFESLQLKKPLSEHTPAELDALESRIQHHRANAQRALSEGAIGSTTPFDYDLQVLRDERAARGTQSAPSAAPAQAAPAVFGGQFKALDALMPYLMPDEIARIVSPRGVLLRNSVNERAGLLGPDEPLIAAALQGQLARGGYESVLPELRNLYGPEAERFASIWASVSPRQLNENALGMAQDIFGRWRDLGGLSADPRALAELAGRSELPARVPNTLAALTAPDPLALSLSGNKVASFYPNLLGKLNPVTLDALQSYGMGINPNRFGNYGSYLTGSGQIRRVAEALGRETGTPWAPAQAQEGMWATIRAMMNLSDAERAIASGTLPELAGQVTPELAGQQWSPQVFRDVLTEGGAMGSDIAPTFHFPLGKPSLLRSLAETIQNSARKRYRF